MLCAKPLGILGRLPNAVSVAPVLVAPLAAGGDPRHLPEALEFNMYRRESKPEFDDCLIHDH